MKKIQFYLIVLIASISISSCGVGIGFVSNQNQNSTQVHLTSNNYKIVDKVSGKSEVSYVLIFGGANKKRLYESAYSDMVKSADLSGSKALVNIMAEEHVGGVPPFYYKRTTTVSAHVIEFIK